ncbi:hypothetical protein BSKO_03740 [Bryopsis sp. KO-2023]|nr:hypothetical protein BSKO_03740 [Bryopsis sp. KO-2023]
MVCVRSAIPVMAIGFVAAGGGVGADGFAERKPHARTQALMSMLDLCNVLEVAADPVGKNDENITTRRTRRGYF